MRKWIPLAAALPVLAGCQTMSGMGLPGMTSDAFSEYDDDGDGVISRSEARDTRVLAENFNTLDTNNSGGIDSQEYAAASAYIANIDFGAVDINGDGVISQREAEAMPDSLKEAFTTVDADGDGNVSPTEFRAASVDLLEGVNFGDVDRDGDSVISPDEAERVPALAEIFDRVDTDADGVISREEFEGARR